MQFKNFVLVIVSLLVAFIFGEIAYRTYVFQTTPIKSFSDEYAASLARRDIKPDEKYEHQVGDKIYAPKVPHPYFGYVLNRALRDFVNNEGFRDPHEFPYVKKKNEFVIGLFGGSMAYEFGVYQQKKHADHLKDLALRLKEALPQPFRDKEIIFLNFALPGYKQPQQFFVSTHFSESIDLAINLEGFNEIEGDQGPPFPVYYPTFSNLFYSLDSERNLKIAEILHWRLRQNNLAAWIQAKPLLRNSSLVYLFFSTFIHYSEKQIYLMHTNLNSYVDKQFPYYPPTYTLNDRLNDSVAIWEKYLRLQNMVLGKSGKNSIYFLQPNQYLGKKPIGEAEAKIAISAEAEADRYKKGYALLLARQQVLAKEGIHAIDLTEIFKDRQEVIYADTCCHINTLGNDILETSILENVIQKLKFKNSN